MEDLKKIDEDKKVQEEFEEHQLSDGLVAKINELRASDQLLAKSVRSNSSAASKRRTRSDRKLHLQASHTSLHASVENPTGNQEADAIIDDDEKPFAELEVNAAAEIGHSSSSVALKT